MGKSVDPVLVDLLVYGQCFIKDGKSIPVADVISGEQLELDLEDPMTEQEKLDDYMISILLTAAGYQKPEKDNTDTLYNAIKYLEKYK